LALGASPLDEMSTEEVREAVEATGRLAGPAVACRVVTSGARA
jgi:hypothetical protein